MPEHSQSEIERVPSKARSQEVGRQWTIKNLSPETVEVTRDAAKRSGMKINAFINQALERAVATHDGHIATAAEPGTPNRDYEHILREIESLKDSMNSLSNVVVKMLARNSD